MVLHEIALDMCHRDTLKKGWRDVARLKRCRSSQTSAERPFAIGRDERIGNSRRQVALQKPSIDAHLLAVLLVELAEVVLSSLADETGISTKVSKSQHRVASTAASSFFHLQTLHPGPELSLLSLVNQGHSAFWQLHFFEKRIALQTHQHIDQGVAYSDYFLHIVQIFLQRYCIFSKKPIPLHRNCKKKRKKLLQ